MNRRNIPCFCNSPIDDPPYDNHISYYLTVSHDNFLLAMNNYQFISSSGDRNQVDLKSVASKQSQLLEEVLYPGMSDIVSLKIRF